MLTKRLVETFDEERQVAEIWIALKALGGVTIRNTRTFEELTERQQRAEIWDAISNISGSGALGGGGIDGINSIASGATERSVTFDIPFAATPRFIPSIEKPNSGSDNIYITGILVNNTGFTVTFNGPTPSNGYYVHWNAKAFTSSSSTGNGYQSPGGDQYVSPGGDFYIHP